MFFSIIKRSVSFTELSVERNHRLFCFYALCGAAASISVTFQLLPFKGYLGIFFYVCSSRFSQAPFNASVFQGIIMNKFLGYIMKRFAVIMIATFLLGVFALAFSTEAFASEQARIDKVSVQYDENLKASFVVNNAFSRGIDEAIASGMPTSFTFIVKLYLNRGFFWPDKHLGTWKFNHTVKYDLLKEEYEVTLEERNYTEKTKDLARMKELMTTGDHIIISPLPALLKGRTYELMVKAELNTVDLPLSLDNVFFFVKLWDFKTGWYVHRFSY